MIWDTPGLQYCPNRAVVATSLVLVGQGCAKAVGDSWKSGLLWPESEPGQRAGGGSSQSGRPCIASSLSFMLGAKRAACTSNARTRRRRA